MHGGRVAVVGGSIAGCAAALAAHRGGAEEVTVHERATGRLEGRGVGLAVHNARYAELEAAGYMDAGMPWVQMDRRHWYVRDGAAPLGRRIADMPFPFRTYTWGPLWRELRDRVPQSVRFREGVTVRTVESGRDGAALRLDGADGGAERFDVVIGADGYRSVVREAAFPDVRPQYAGYLAWRGAFPEERLDELDIPGLTGRPQDAWAVGACIYAVFPGGHVILYRIPDGRGGRRANWVLYTAPPPDLDLRLETPTSLPPGTLGDALHERFAHVTGDLLPPYWGGLMRLTPREEVFIQPMYDFTAPHYAISGRLLLAGDAATVARPHTGAGAVKALQDATALEAAFTASAHWSDALERYDAERAPTGRTMVDLGRRLGSALVQQTPDWSALDQAGVEAWWGKADGSGSFGGRELAR